MSSSRVDELRERLGTLLPFLSESARADLEELFVLAARAPAAKSPKVEPPSLESTVEQGVPLRAILTAVLASSEEPLRVRDITDGARARGWRTNSAHPGHVVAAVLSSKDEFVSVRRGIYALRSTPAAAEAERAASIEPAAEPLVLDEDDGAVEPSVVGSPEVAPEPVSEVRFKPPPLATLEPAPVTPARPPLDSAAASEAHRELEFLLRMVEDARPDTAVLSPALLRLQITGWIAQARALRDRARGDGRVERETGKIAAELGVLCKLWWPGSVEALKLDARPVDVLRSFGGDDVSRSELTWSEVATLLDDQLASAWATPGFDDGWADGRWLCDDERYVGERLDEAEAILAKVGTPITERPTGRASFDVSPVDAAALLHAARGMRWVRGVVSDGARWGAIVGRLRWLAATNTHLSKGPLTQVLAADYVPLGRGWGFDELLRRAERLALTAELAEPGIDLLEWIGRAINAFDTLELSQALAARRDEVAALDPASVGSRRVRGRLRKLRLSMGMDDVEGASTSSQEATSRESTAPEVEGPPPDPFGSIRRTLHARLSGRRALFISNREDGLLQAKVSSAFGLEVEWCVAHPRRVSAATDAIRGGRYDVILSATGFQDHTMDAALFRAAKDSGTLFVRVNRGRPAACARAIARELGMASAA